MNFLRKLFNLDKLEALTLENERLKQLWELEAQKRLNETTELTAQNKDLRAQLYAQQAREWTSVNKFKPNDVYFVVTQGGYYQVKGYRIIRGAITETTKRAIAGGFVVATREEAERLQSALHKLVRGAR